MLCFLPSHMEVGSKELRKLGCICLDAHTPRHMAPNMMHTAKVRINRLFRRYSSLDRNGFSCNLQSRGIILDILSECICSGKAFYKVDTPLERGKFGHIHGCNEDCDRIFACSRALQSTFRTCGTPKRAKEVRAPSSTEYSLGLFHVGVYSHKLTWVATNPTTFASCRTFRICTPCVSTRSFYIVVAREKRECYP